MGGCNEPGCACAAWLAHQLQPYACLLCFLLPRPLGILCQSNIVVNANCRSPPVAAGPGGAEHEWGEAVKPLSSQYNGVTW